jgi:predicted ATPase/DNA-binding CsgD family transcriptional regulator
MPVPATHNVRVGGSDDRLPERLSRAGLTEREAEVLWAVSERLRNREIASRFHLSIRTVETHVAALLRKLEVPDRTALAAIGTSLQRAAGSTTAFPVPLTTLVGRELETATVIDAIASHRLVTLIGPGGVGKTRLAVHVAAQRAQQFPDSARLADLAPVGPELVTDTLARTLGVVPQPGWALHDVLRDAAGGLDCLLVIDNCEHVISDVAGIVADLLVAGARLRVLATSREPLGVVGEMTYQVPPLTLPDPDHDDAATGPRSDAVQMFVERAAAGSTGFDLTDDNAGAVAALCRRLDGLPLAIELAAARARSFGPAELLRHLDQRFDLLAAGARNAAPRHRTLRAAIDWSYQLLDDDERALFDAFGVFPAEFDFDAAQAVWSSDRRTTVLTLLPKLVDKSLVTTSGRGDRYRLLESLRAFAAEQLERSEATAAVTRQRHAQHYLGLAERAAMRLRGPDQRSTLDQLIAEQPNLRAGLGYSLAARDIDACWRWIAALQRFWDTTGQRPEAWTWIERVLALGEPTASAATVAGLAAASTTRQASDARASYELARQAERLAVDLDDLARARAGRAVAMGSIWVRPDLTLPALQDALARLGDDQPWERALTMQNLAQATADPAESQEWGRASVALFRTVGDLMYAANTLFIMAQRAIYAGVADSEVDTWLAESRSLAEASGSNEDIVHAQVGFGQLSWLRGDHAEAPTIMRDCLPTLRRLGDQRCTGRALYVLGARAYEEGQAARAQELLSGSIQATLLAGQSYVLVNALEALAAAVLALGRPEHAAVVLGTARAQRQSPDTHLRPPAPPDDGLVNSLVDELGDEAFAAAIAVGQQLSPLDALRRTSPGAPVKFNEPA